MEQNSYSPVWVRRLLPFLVLLVGVLVTVGLIKTRKKPQRQARQEKGVLVEVLRVAPTSRQIVVRSQGTVQPARQVDLSPQVSGKVLWVHTSLRIGGMIEEGTPIIRLDPVDYQLALEKARAQLVEAEKSFAETESNAAVAQREWKILGEKTGQREANPLALYEPQLKLAQANMRSARAQVQQAQVNLSRTTIRAPFNLQVRSESVEHGQYVVVGQKLATVSGTDAAEIIVPLPVAELRWITLPPLPLTATEKRSSKHEPADQPTVSRVRVALSVGGKRYEREGQLLRSVGEIEADGRMARVVVGLDDPYNLRADPSPDFRPQFQLGAFVDVRLDGRRIENVFALPATALRLGSVVWVAGEGDKLQLRKVVVARLTEQEALVTSGLSTGDRVVLTTITGAVEGLQLRIGSPGSGSETATAKRLGSDAQ